MAVEVFHAFINIIEEGDVIATIYEKVEAKDSVSAEERLFHMHPKILQARLISTDVFIISQSSLRKSGQ